MADMHAGVEDCDALPSLVPMQTGERRPPFFCSHALFGVVSFLRHLAHHLGPEQPFYALRQRGLDGVTAPHTRIETMAAYYVEQITKVQPHGPYLLGGFSFGGLVVYEMAQQLHAQGRWVALLAVIDTWFPNVAKPRFSPAPAAGLRRRIGFHVDNLLEAVRDFGPRGAGRYLASRLARKTHWFDIPPEPPEPPGPSTLPPRLRKLERLNTEATKAYTPLPYPGRITFLVRQRPEEVGNEVPRAPKMLALGGWEVRSVYSPYHFNLLYEPYVGDVAKKLKRCIDKALTTRAAAI
ncbi:MAG TPA: alpha/beta fold hydrolase [bacterium]|nr:alpha/beta fold hydrolase [bacterium]